MRLTKKDPLFRWSKKKVKTPKALWIKSDIPHLDGTSYDDEMLKKAIAISLYEETSLSLQKVDT